MTPALAVISASILASSDRCVLIQSKIESTNNLINESINRIESAFGDFSGNIVKFAALDEKKWKEEIEKYRINVKNKVEYKYIDEVESEIIDNQQSVDKKDDLESVAEEIFGTFEVE